MAVRNPCDNVRVSCQLVSASAKHVTISQQGVTALAKEFKENYKEYYKDCQWNTDWHYYDEFDHYLT